MEMFRTLNLKIFGDTDLAYRTLNAALHYLKYYHERFWYETGDNAQHIDDCIRNLEEITKKYKLGEAEKHEDIMVKWLEEWAQSKR